MMMRASHASHEKPGSPLLRLPRVIRHQIYRFVGMAPWDGSRYTFHLHGGDPRLKDHEWTALEPFPHWFHGLLLSCRDIYTEAAALLYSANQFVLHYTIRHYAQVGSLGPLLALTPTSAVVARHPQGCSQPGFLPPANSHPVGR
jgi:hypothetical protein